MQDEIFMRKDVELDEMIRKLEGIQAQFDDWNVLSKQLAEYVEVVKVQLEDFKDLREGTLDFNLKRDVWYSVWNWTVKVTEWMATDFVNLGSSSSAGQGVAGEDRQVALCVTANPALASHRVDCKMRSSPSEPASGSWVSAWQLAETAVAAWQEALTTAAAAAAVAAAAVASFVGRDGQRSTSQPCRALKALASKLRLSTGARFSGSWLMASVVVFFPSLVFGER